MIARIMKLQKVALLVFGLWFAGLVIDRSLHNISYANLFGESASAAAASNPTDAQLKAALQKRLLIPDPSRIEIGPPSPGPLKGMSQRTITLTGGEGQKIELKYFTNGSATDHGLIAHEYADFDMANPWQRVDLKGQHLEDHATLGPADAPVTIIEFADFECPYCARAFNEIETLVTTTYKDRVRLVWKNFPLGAHVWAEQAAIAAECARQQNPSAFWVFARNFYRDQNDITAQNLRDHIDQYGKEAQLDAKALNACVLSDAAERRVEQDKKDGEAINVTSTPTFLVNGVLVVGLPTSNVFDFVITSQLEQRRAAAH
jgi:predicted DsbA family dithiol-disulfide isomerase